MPVASLFLSTPSGWRATRPRQLLQPEAKFLSTPSGWRATGKRDNIRPARQIFLSTPSGWRATRRAPRLPGITCVISIHALRVEGDPDTDGDGFPDQYFYPRPPGGGRHQYRVRCNPERKISIHALRVEGDGRHPLTRLRDRRHFYPRPPGGGRPRVRLSLRRRSTFLSTPSGWRATGLVVLIPAHAVDFYPRPPGGGRPPLFSHSPCNTPISIHALRVEGDSLLRRFSKAVLQFLSTPSGWRATARAQRFGRIFCISIHALRVEGDNVLHIGLFGC